MANNNSNNPTYIDSMNLFGCHVKQIPCIVGEGSPTTDTYGAIGCLYMDTSSSKGDMYKCININDGKYTWVKMIENTNEDSGQNPPQGGLTTAQIAALDGMFRACGCAEKAPDAYEAFMEAFGISVEDIEQADNVLTIRGLATEPTQDGSVLTIA